MTGRCPRMDAPRIAPRGTRRVACLAAGLICALGVLSGVALRGSEVVHHHAPAVATVVQVADGHATNVRDQHPVATVPAAVAQARHRIALGATYDTSIAAVAIDAIRTRGPPVSA